MDLLQTLSGYERREISSITELLGSLVDTLLLNVQRVTTRVSSADPLGSAPLRIDQSQLKEGPTNKVRHRARILARAAELCRRHWRTPCSCSHVRRGQSLLDRSKNYDFEQASQQKHVTKDET